MIEAQSQSMLEMPFWVLSEREARGIILVAQFVMKSIRMREASGISVVACSSALSNLLSILPSVISL
jgi:hypothetical protein